MIAADDGAEVHGDKIATFNDPLSRHAMGQAPGVTVYHAGTRLEDGKFLTSGGRVLGVTAVGSDLSEALARSYAAAEKIVFEGVHYRKDIGKIKK